MFPSIFLKQVAAPQPAGPRCRGRRLIWTGSHRRPGSVWAQCWATSALQTSMVTVSEDIDLLQGCKLGWLGHETHGSADHEVRQGQKTLLMELLPKGFSSLLPQAPLATPAGRQEGSRAQLYMTSSPTPQDERPPPGHSEHRQHFHLDKHRELLGTRTVNLMSLFN